MGVHGSQFGEKDCSNLHRSLGRVRVDVHAVRGFVHDTQRAEHFIGACWHRSILSQVSQHVHDTNGPIEDDASFVREVAKG